MSKSWFLAFFLNITDAVAMESDTILEGQNLHLIMDAGNGDRKPDTDFRR